MSSETDTPADDTGTPTSKVRRYTRFMRRWHTWVGDVDDLARLGRECQKLYRKCRHLYEARQNQAPEREEQSPRADPGKMIVHSTFQLWSNDSKPGFEMTVVDGPDRISGSVDAVVAELDRRTVNRIEFRGVVSENDILSVTLRRKPGKEAEVVDLHVEAEDAGWAREALAHLSEQIDRAQPKWAWWHRRGGIALFGFFNVAVLSIPILVISTLDVSWEAVLPLLLFYVPLGLLVAYGAARSVLGWLLPPFEITAPGASPKGSRLIAYVVTTVVGFVGSVVAAIITQS